MRADAAEADRRREVREAARGWRRAGAIDEATLATVVAAYPDDRVRLGPAFRTLVFVFTAIALQAFFLLFMTVLPFRGRETGVLVLLYGLGLCGLTELQVGPLRRDQGGAETASGLLGLAFLLGGVAWLLSDLMGLKFEPALAPFLAAAAVLFATAAVRWGSTFCAAVAALWFFALLTRLGPARLLWVLAGLGLAGLCVAGGESPRLAPTHRRSAQAVLAVALLALYVAAHLGSWDSGLLEEVSSLGRRVSGRGSPLRALSVLASAVLPLAILAAGVRLRHRLLLNLGAVLGIASLVTLRFYVHLAPLWVVLTVAGAVAIGLALALRRWLDSGEGRVRGGFTAEMLFQDPEKRSALEAVAAVAAFTPGARVVAEEPRFTGGGGRSGGGGGTGSF